MMGVAGAVGGSMIPTHCLMNQTPRKNVPRTPEPITELAQSYSFLTNVKDQQAGQISKLATPPNLTRLSTPLIHNNAVKLDKT